MRRMIPFLLLAASAAAPLAAQSWDGPDQRPQRGDRAGEQRRADPRAVENDGRSGRDFDRRDNDRRDNDRAGWRDRDDRRDDRRYDDRRDGARGDWRGDRADGRQDWRNDRWQGRNDGRGGWNNQWRGDRRYDWQGYRSSNRNLYRAPRYYGPRGSDYSRWSRGYRVQPYFYGRNYWINDPYRYRLPPVYGNYRWVRYYDDVALIDIQSGLIEDIIYSFFYR